MTKGVEVNTWNPWIDYYDVLGIDSEATEDEIDEVWRNLAKTYHSDQRKHVSAKTREKGEKRLAEINEAHTALTKHRESYDLEWRTRKREEERKGRSYKPPPKPNFEEEKKAQQKKADDARRAREKETEDARQREEARRAEEARAKAEEERRAAEKQREEERLAEEVRLEAERLRQEEEARQKWWRFGTFKKAQPKKAKSKPKVSKTVETERFAGVFKAVNKACTGKYAPMEESIETCFRWFFLGCIQVPQFLFGWLVFLFASWLLSDPANFLGHFLIAGIIATPIARFVSTFVPYRRRRFLIFGLSFNILSVVIAIAVVGQIAR